MTQTSDAARVVAAFGGAWGGHDLESVLSMITDDCLFEATGPMCLLDDKPVAGLGPQMNADAPPSWSTYISVADADMTAAAVKEDGGDVLMGPMDVLDVGRMAVAIDPTGAVFSIWQPRQHAGAAIVNEPNTFCWSELTTRAPQKS